VKTVPTLRVVSKTDAPAALAELGVVDLPAEVQLALTEIASAARERRRESDVARELLERGRFVSQGRRQESVGEALLRLAQLKGAS
jgi:hypothetical protein